MSKAITYYRFSDRRDSESCQSNETQAELCRAYCEQQGHEIVAEFADDAISGAEEDRPVLWNAIESLRRGYVLVVYRADRLARNVYLHELIYRAVKKKRATIEVVAGGRNGDSAEDELLRTVMAAFAAYERRVIAARTKAASLRYQANGIAVSHLPPYGKQAGPSQQVMKGGVLVEQRTWVDDTAEQAVIAEIREMDRGGMGLREIARELDIRGVPARGRRWHHKVIGAILAREGKTVAQDAPRIAPTGRVEV